jgi:type IV pilus assembly protein PilB
VTDNRKFLDLLVSESVLIREDSHKISDKFKGNAFEILKYLLKEKVAPRHVLGRLWGDSIGVSYVNLEKSLFQAAVIKKLPEVYARKNRMIPLYQLQGVVTTAMATPQDAALIREAEYLMASPVSAVFSLPEEIRDAIDIQYQSDDALAEQVARIADDPLFRGTDKVTVEQMKRLAGEQAIIDFVNNLILLAFKERASDIHIDPLETAVSIRLRVDGMLHERLTLERSLLSPVVSRLKVMSGLDITERRRPQDGRVKLQLSHRYIELRLSTVSTIYGEKMVLRILGQNRQDNIPQVGELFFSHRNFKMLNRILNAPNGVFFVTGPTGSGKTTTLFSMLQHLNTPEINIMTAEDPVEYTLPGINQVQINPAIEFHFANALRSFLRQDPDVILIGEIRDLETAHIASQAAMTGHLVLTTMHTNTALQAITRLIEIGVEPFLVAPSIIGVMAQRLVRRICPYCREKYELPPEEIERYFVWDGKTNVHAWRSRGCVECHNTGYRGRLAIQEVFVINDSLRALIAKEASILEIEQCAKDDGFKPMRYDGIKKVLMGYTTFEEVERVTAMD